MWLECFLKLLNIHFSYQLFSCSYCFQGNASAYSVVLLDPHSSHIFYIIYFYLLYYILSVKSVNCYAVVLFWTLYIYYDKFFLFFFILEVFPHSNRRAKAEGVVHCRDCKAEWGNVIVIWDYINTIDLIWIQWDAE